MKKITILFLCFCLMVSVFAFSISAEEDPGISAFQIDNVPGTTFTDVPKTAWYYNAVSYAQAAGLISGTNGKFNPNNNITYAECITIAVVVYEKYHGITPTDTVAAAGEAWYMPIVRRAQNYGILPKTSLSYTAKATRELVAAILYSMLPEKEFTKEFNYRSVPDVDSTNSYYKEIMALYNAGIVSGKDAIGTFTPKASITRVETVAMLYTTLNPDKRAKDPNPKRLQNFDIDLMAMGCTFSDVPSSHWALDAIAAQQMLGIMSGTGNNQFSPNGTVTIAQVLVTAVAVYERYNQKSMITSTGGTWYTPYVEKAIAYGIITKSQYTNYNAAATRSDVVAILYKSLPMSAFPAINTVEGLPDINKDDKNYNEVLAFYKAGVVTGTDKFGTFNGSANITRAELAVMLTNLVVPELRSRTYLKPFYKLTYGYSGEYVATNGKSGYPLTAYKIGHGENVMLLTYCLHGVESANVSGDAIVIYELGMSMLDFAKKNYDVIEKKNWTVYVLPVCNPDGMYYQNGTGTGIGRQTKYYYKDKAKTQLVYTGDHGIDMNRSFDYKFEANTQIGTHYYCGTTPMQCVESEALAAFAKEIKGSKKNIVIDTHGWYSQIITTNTADSVFFKAFKKQAPYKSYTDGANRTNSKGSGYFSAYCKYVLGYTEGGLIELPRACESLNSITAIRNKFNQLKCREGFQAAILEILNNY